MQGIQANVKMFDQTHRNKKSAEINVIEDPESVTESIWVRGLIQNGFEIWEGTSGNDLIIGNQERTNFIYAQWGDDHITGGDGADVISGGSGSDVFIYTSTSNSGMAIGTFDVIKDFDAGTGSSGIDKLNLAGVVQGTFSYLGDETQTFSGAGDTQARFNSATKILEIDADGSGAADMQLELENVEIANLDLDDFITVGS